MSFERGHQPMPPANEAMCNLSTMQHFAHVNFADAYRHLPPGQEVQLIFQNSSILMRARSGWPKKAHIAVLYIGQYEDSTASVKHPVYAVIHGERRVNVRWLAIPHEENKFIWLAHERALPYIDLIKPFIYLVNNTSHHMQARMIQALVLYYFVEAHMLSEFKSYPGFMMDFRRACEVVFASRGHVHTTS